MLVAELTAQYRSEAEQRLAAARQQRILAEHQQQEALQQQRAELRRRQEQARAELEALAGRTGGVAAAAPRRRETQKAVAEYAELAKPLLGALKKAAREGETRTWESIADRTGIRRLRQLGDAAKVEVLVIAERGTLDDRPLWSVVLAAAGGQEALAIHRAVCERLGRPLFAADEALRARLGEERTILQHGW